MQTELPIIIVNYNGLEDTIACIRSITSEDFRDYRIYLVDNNSSLSEQARIHELYSNHPKVKIIQNEKNIGFGAAHNEVINYHLIDVSWQYVALINNDTIVDKVCFKNAIDYILKDNIDVLSMKMINYYDRNMMDSAGHKILSNGEILPVAHGKEQKNYNKVKASIGASGGACIYSRKCIEDIGLFDPYFFVGYEDAEFGLRAFISGYRCTYFPQAIVYHKGGQSIKKVFNSDYAIKTFKNIRYTNYKLLPWSLLLLFGPLRIIRLTLILLISIVSLRWNITQVVFRSFIGFYSSDLRLALSARKKFYQNRSHINSSLILKSMKSTLLHDIENFYSIFVNEKSTAIDDYR